MSTNLHQTLESIEAEASDIESELDQFKNEVSALEDAVDGASRAFSGSWLGYHSRVYYEGLKRPPAGARFDPTSGLTGHFRGTKGNWVEYAYDDVYEELISAADAKSLDDLESVSNDARTKVFDLRERLVSVLTTVAERADTEYVKKLLRDAESAEPVSAKQYIRHMQPSGRFMSNDIAAISNGLETPPHVVLYATVQALQSPFSVAKDIAKISRRTKEHLLHRKDATAHATTGGGNVFIGHGRSTAWRDLKDFLQDRLDLPWDEFNRVPVAGITNIGRLTQMLDDASIAFLVMTAEDEQSDGSLHARMNVVHEAGLFQGRLGFTRAIVVLEEGCEEFSNIQGLGQIRFPEGNINAIFEEVREVLEREGVIDN